MLTKLAEHQRNAGFFIYLNLSSFLPPASSTPVGALASARTYNDHQATEQELALAQRFLDAGVVLHPGEEHGKHIGWFRMVYTQPEDILSVALDRMFKALAD